MLTAKRESSLDMRCRLCRGETKLIAESPDFLTSTSMTPTFQVRYCACCHVAVTFPDATDAELAPHYPSDYVSYKRQTGLVGWLIHLKYEQEVKKLLRLVRPGASIFEIGAGRAEFLSVAKRTGFTVGGIEPSADCRKAASERGITLAAGYATQIEFPEPYDLVILRHVLEHVNESEWVLKEIFTRGLKPGGSLLLKLPRLDSWEFKLYGRYWGGLDVPRHRMHFSERGIIQLLTRIGFCDVKVQGEVTPLDLIRSNRELAKYEQTNPFRFVAKAIALLPYPLEIFFFQGAGALLVPWRAGRMIVTARKPG